MLSSRSTPTFCRAVLPGPAMPTTSPCGRGSRAGAAGMNRLYSAETWFTGTGASADHRFPREAQRDGGGPARHRTGHGALLAGAPSAAAARQVDRLGGAGPAAAPRRERSSGRRPAAARVARAGPRDQLRAGQCREHRRLHRLERSQSGRINSRRSANWWTTCTRAGWTCWSSWGSIRVTTRPADLDFSDAMRSVRYKVHHGTYNDETGVLCQWHIPAAHFPGGMERLRRPGRHGFGHSAADRAALPGPLAARAVGGDARPAEPAAL